MRRRGIILMVTICSLWLAGLLIGGVSVIDSRQQPEDGLERGTSAWFYGQALIAPSFAVNHYLHRLQRPFGDYHPKVTQNPSYRPGFGKISEQGVLYTALAGLLNLLAMLDLIYCDPQFRQERDRRPQPTRPSPQPAKPPAPASARSAGT